MNTAFWKAAPLVVLLSLPNTSSARAADAPPKPHEKDTVVDGQRIVTLEDDGPASDHVRRSSRHGYLGVHLIDMTPDLRAFFGAPRDAGVLVAEVDSSSPAAKAGVRVGDVITRADDERLESAGDLARSVRPKRSGDTLKIEIERDRTAKSLTATIQERRGQQLEVGDLGLDDLTDRLHDIHFRLPRIEGLESLERLREKLNDVEKRLDDLEKKVR